MTDPNLKSSLYLKNVVEISAVTVTPILYLSNGNRFTLPDVTLECLLRRIYQLQRLVPRQRCFCDSEHEAIPSSGNLVLGDTVQRCQQLEQQSHLDRNG